MNEQELISFLLEELENDPDRNELNLNAYGITELTEESIEAIAEF